MNIKNLVRFGVLMISIVLVVSAFAQTPVGTTMPPPPPVTNPELPMIRSIAALRSYALGEAGEVNAFMGGVSITSSQSTYDSRTWVGTKSAGDIIETMKTLRLSGETVNTSDSVTIGVAINDRSGDSLFYGYNDVKPVQGIDRMSWSLPASAGNVMLVLSHAIGIRFDKSVSVADIVATNTDGTTSVYNLRTLGRKLYFPKESAGLQNAYLRVGFGDGTTMSYTIATGMSRQSVPLSATIAGKIAEVAMFKNVTSVTMLITSSRGKGITPTIEVELASSANVVFDISTTETTRPTKLWVRKSSSQVWVPFNAGMTTTINLEAGVTYVIPEIQGFDNVSPQATGTGGKG